MYEHRDTPLLPRALFVKRMAAHMAAALALLGGSLGIGMFGYMRLEGLDWRSAFLNASMLLGGMGPVDPPQTPRGKLFAGLYALYAGLGVLVFAAILFAPMIHRMMHRFHVDTDDDA